MILKKNETNMKIWYKKRFFNNIKPKEEIQINFFPIRMQNLTDNYIVLMDVINQMIVKKDVYGAAMRHLPE